MRKTTIKVGILITSGLISLLVIVGIFISIPKPIEIPEIPVENEKITSQDAYWYKDYSNELFWEGYESKLLTGRFNATYYTGHYGCRFRFSLENRPIDWNNCNLSVYIYQTTGDFYESLGWLMNAYETDWTEEKPKGNYYWYTEHYNLTLIHGLNSINITDLMIEALPYANNTFTIYFYPYIVHSIWSDIDKMAYIYSREANMGDIYKPRIIWS